MKNWQSSFLKMLAVEIFFLFPAMNLLFASQDARELHYYYRISKMPTVYPDSMEVLFDFSVVQKDLVFMKQNSFYQARVRFGVFVLNQQEDVLFEKSWRRKIDVADYAATKNDTTFHQFSTSTLLPPGTFKIKIESLDENVDIPSYNEIALKIKDYSDRKVISGDILLYEGLHDFTTEEYSNVTMASTNLCRNDFTLLSEAYAYKSIQDFSAEAVWYDENQVVRKDDLQIVQNGNRLKFFILYPIAEVPQGSFDVQFQINGRNIKKQVVELKIEVIKHVDYLSETSIDKAIEQMIYIGEGALWDSLRNAQTVEDKRYWYSRFWQEYYPSPDSTKNPVQEEYFRRIRYVNREFGSGEGGWRSDRGKTYIVYGPPEQVERQTDQYMRGYEIWTYSNIDMQFIFVDESGSGNYRLVDIQ